MKKLTPKTIFIWKSFGYINVYLIFGGSKYQELFGRIRESLMIEGCNTEGLHTIDDLLRSTGVVGKLESFEYGTGWGVLN